MDPAEDLLRRLALNDENVVGDVMTQRAGIGRHIELGSTVDLLVRLGALLAVGAAAPSLREVVEKALAAGVTTDEIVGVLVCVGPTIGVAGMVASASKLAVVIGYDLENGHDAANESEPDAVRHGTTRLTLDDVTDRRGSR